MKFFCIGDEDTVRGLALAGIQGVAATNSAEADHALDLALSLPNCAIVILTEKVASYLAVRITAVRQERDRPLIAQIPGPEGPTASSISLMALVEESVGISLNDHKER